jgi:hypothetical protein
MAQPGAQPPPSNDPVLPLWRFAGPGTLPPIPCARGIQTSLGSSVRAGQKAGLPGRFSMYNASFQRRPWRGAYHRQQRLEERADRAANHWLAKHGALPKKKGRPRRRRKAKPHPY